MHTPIRKIAVLAVLFSLVLTACGGAAPSAQPTAPSSGAQPTPAASLFDDPSVPFEGVVQILAMYYDENGDIQEGWTGSGTIVSPDGYILTNAHVVLPDRYFPVDELIVAMTVNQDEEPVPMYYAETLQADATLDLAIIRVTHDYDGNEVDHDSLNLPFVPLGNSDDLNLGDAITILGYPGIGGNTVTLTRGEVSGFTSQPEYGTRAFIKTSATIAGGNSGGLAATVNGHLIGVPTQLGYGGDDQFVDCRVLADTNRDGFVDDFDSCIPTGGFINALRPVTLALPLLEAAQNGEVNIIGGEEQEVAVEPASSGTFTDNFSDETSGWDILATETYSTYYQNGEYIIEAVGGGGFYVGEPYLNFENVEMTIEFRFEEPTVDGEVNFVCRYIDVDNYYEFRVRADGAVGISKWLAGDYVPLTDFISTGAVLGDSMHQVQITCDDGYLGLSLDSETVIEANDDSFISGDVGVAAYNPEESTTLVAAFDNFEAVALSAQTTSGEAGSTVLYEEFNDTSNGWAVGTEADWSLDLVDGQYLFSITPSQFQSFSAITVANYEDILINVDVHVAQPAGDGDIGVLCRYQDVDNFYALEVSEDGYYSIWKEVNNEVISLVDWTFSDLIPTDGSSFALNAWCDGAQLSLGINAEMLATVNDSEFASGGVGLITGTWANGNQVIAFDNFEVIEYE